VVQQTEGPIQPHHHQTYVQQVMQRQLYLDQKVIHGHVMELEVDQMIHVQLNEVNIKNKNIFGCFFLAGID